MYLKCPPQVCEDRDVKGMYKKAKNGEIKDFTGVSAPYDIPTNPDLIIDTENLVQHKSINDKVDVIYMNVSDKNNLDIAILNSKAYLKDGGYLLLVVKTADILVNKYGVEPENNQRKKIRMLFEMIQEINLADFFKDNTMIVAKFLSS